jgi:phospholipid N-methyltransferase
LIGGSCTPGRAGHCHGKRFNPNPGPVQQLRKQQGMYMTSASPLREQNYNRIAFLREFLRHPQQVGSIVPSSRFLERRVVEVAAVSSAHMIVELGAGTGGITRAILRAMRANATLMAVEVNHRFCTLLQRMEADRLIVHRSNALELHDAIALHGLPAPDVVISGIPFSTMSRTTGTRILDSIFSALRPGGCFVAYQISAQVHALASPLLGTAQVEVEFLNIPPMRIYRWQKDAGHSSAHRDSGSVEPRNGDSATQSHGFPQTNNDICPASTSPKR